MRKRRSVILIVFLILLAMPLVYAGTYGAGAYSADTYGVGEVPVTPNTPSGGSSSGGGSSCIYDEKYDWECGVIASNFEPTTISYGDSEDYRCWIPK